MTLSHIDPRKLGCDAGCHRELKPCNSLAWALAMTCRTVYTSSCTILSVPSTVCGWSVLETSFSFTHAAATSRATWQVSCQSCGSDQPAIFCLWLWSKLWIKIQFKRDCPWCAFVLIVPLVSSFLCFLPVSCFQLLLFLHSVARAFFRTWFPVSAQGLLILFFSHTRGNIFSQFLHLWFRSFCFWHLTVGEPLTTAIKIVESDQNAADPQWLTDCSVVVACRTTLIRKQVLFVWSGSIPNHATFKSCRIQCTSHGSYQVLQHSVTMHCGIHPL